MTEYIEYTEAQVRLIWFNLSKVQVILSWLDILTVQVLLSWINGFRILIFDISPRSPALKWSELWCHVQVCNISLNKLIGFHVLITLHHKMMYVFDTNQLPE